MFVNSPSCSIARKGTDQPRTQWKHTAKAVPHLEVLVREDRRRPDAEWWVATVSRPVCLAGKRLEAAVSGCCEGSSDFSSDARV